MSAPSDQDNIGPIWPDGGGERPAIPFAFEMIESWLEAFHHVRQLRQQIVEQPSRVFFYPACRFDWQPLMLFHSICTTFVYCDLGTQPEDFEREVRVVRELDGLNLGAIRRFELADLRLDPESARVRTKLPAHEQPRYHAAVRAWATRSGWAKYVPVTHTAGATRRTLHLYYLGAEGYSAYVNLFAEQQAAPKVLCLKGAHACDNNWTQFLRWESPLGRAVSACAEPEILVVHRDRNAPSERSDNWPWHHRRRTYETWDAATFAKEASY